MAELFHKIINGIKKPWINHHSIIEMKTNKLNLMLRIGGRVPPALSDYLRMIPSVGMLHAKIENVAKIMPKRGKSFLTLSFLAFIKFISNNEALLHF